MSRTPARCATATALDRRRPTPTVVRASTIRETLRDAVVEATAREPAKVLAFRLHITDEGARKIQTGECLPRPEHLAILAGLYPNIFAAWNRCVNPQEDGE